MKPPNRRAKGRNREIVILTRSARETEDIGACLAEALDPPRVVLLSGPLGVGKTILTRGIARGLGIEDPSTVSSPSFTLVNIYQGSCAIYHVDLYRLSGDRDLYSAGLEEIIQGDGITIIEWSERIEYSIPHAIKVQISDLGGDARSISIRSTESRVLKHLRAKRTGTRGA